jgi:hypothetical protein
MLFEGLSRNIGLRLLDIECGRDVDLRDAAYSELYTKEKESMNRVMFKDSFYIVRFVEVFSECIKKTHTMLPYILRNQYKKADEVYKIVVQEHNQEGHVIDVVNSITSFQELYREVMVYIIAPMLKRHGVYSPNIVYMLMIDLYMYMVGEYQGYMHRDVGREFLRSYVSEQTNEGIDGILWLSPTMKAIMKDELQVWKAMKRVHKKK